MRRISLLTGIFTVAVFVVAAVIIGLLYRTALSQQTQRLEEVAHSQARTIEAIARHEAKYSHFTPAESEHGDALASTLAQVRDANEQFSGFGLTGEFTLARREGDSIVYLLTQRHPGSIRSMAIPFDGTKGEPMRRALSGLSGTVIGPDYRGVRVLAAHEPVNAFGLGVVAKVDLTEIQAPFVRAGLIGLVLALVTVLLGSLLFYRITNPVLQQLQESETRQRNAQQLAHLGSWTLDRLKNRLTWSDEVYRIFGLQPQEFGATYEAFLAAVHPDDRGAVDSAYSDSVRDNRDGYEIEHRVVRNDTGEVRIVHEKCEHGRNASGRIIRSTGMVHDITERKQAEEAVARRNAVLRGVNQILASALTNTTDEEIAVACLEVAEKVTGSAFGFVGEIGSDGLLHDLAVSNTGWDLCRMHDRTGHRRPPGTFPMSGIHGRVLADGKSLIANEPAAHPDRVGLPDGHPPLTAFLGVPLLRAGETAGMIGLANRPGGFRPEDMAALEMMAPAIVEALDSRRADQALRETLEDLKRSNEELEQFAYVASHDLQQPLRMVASYVELLGQRYKGRLDEKADKYIAYASGGAIRMHHLVNDLLAFSRVGTRTAPLSPVHLDRTVAQARENLTVAIEQSGAVIETGSLPVVAGDETQLVQLFQNLLDNAVKFRGAMPPAVSVSCRDAGSEWEFAVRDNGIGIDPKHAERVFGVFKRLHTEQEYPGTGIGLALCRKIVGRHGGQIRVEPAEGGGSVFRFTLPKQPAAESIKPAGAAT
jgi:PAS domain S-box-containing protein